MLAVDAFTLSWIAFHRENPLGGGLAHRGVARCIWSRRASAAAAPAWSRRRAPCSENGVWHYRPALPPQAGCAWRIRRMPAGYTLCTATSAPRLRITCRGSTITPTIESEAVRAVKPYAAIVKAPEFSIGIECNADEITGIDYLEPAPELAPKTPLAQEAVRQLRAWLKDPHFEFGLPLAPAGTHFQRRVWDCIAPFRRGKTMSYGEVAGADPQRPARGGQCLRCQPLSHRRALPPRGGGQHGLGGFARNSGGFLLDIKKWLLRHEHAGF
jgi:methylated-DNA-[protein]-cysteine S-methyltransferase